MSAYRETQLIGFVIYCITVVACCFLPVLFLVDLELEVQFALRSFAIMYFFSSFFFFFFFFLLFLIDDFKIK